MVFIREEFHLFGCVDSKVLNCFEAILNEIVSLIFFLSGFIIGGVQVYY